VDGDREIRAALEQHWTASAAGDHRSVRAELMIDTFGNRMKASTSMRAGLQLLKEEQRCFDEWLLGWDFPKCEEVAPCFD
jgi:hypothetical protein